MYCREHKSRKNRSARCTVTNHTASNNGLILKNIIRPRWERKKERGREKKGLSFFFFNTACWVKYVFHNPVLCKVGALLSWVYTLRPCKNSFTTSTALSLNTTCGAFSRCYITWSVWVCSGSHQISWERLDHFSVAIAVKTVRLCTKKCKKIIIFAYQYI